MINELGNELKNGESILNILGTGFFFFLHDDIASKLHLKWNYK